MSAESLLEKIPILTALFSMSFSTILLFLVFLVARKNYRDRFSLYWLVGWGFYAIRSGFEIAESFSPGLRFVAAGNFIALCGSSIYLCIAATRLGHDHPAPFLPAGLFSLAAAAIVAAEILGADNRVLVPAVFVPCGLAQIATSLPLLRYRSASRTVSPVAAAVSLILLGILNISYYKLRPDPLVAPMAFQLGTLLRVALGIAVAVMLFESSREEARRAASRYQALFQGLTEAVYIVDFSGGRFGRFIEVNEQATRLLGYSREELLAMGPAGIENEGSHPEDEIPLLSEAKSVLLHRVFVSKTGERIPVDISARLFELDGHPAVLGIARDKREREASEARLREALGEKEALLRELHHRVKNNLQIIASLLSLQGSTMSDPAAIEALEESKAKVASIALVHELLYNDQSVATIELKSYFAELVKQIGSSRERSSEIEVRIEGLELRCGMDRAVPIGLILAELVTNAYKYAFRGRTEGMIRIEIGREGVSDIVKIEDDGVGMREESRSAKTLGITLVNILAEQLRGEISVTSSQAGTSWRLAVPAGGESRV